jgi:hypothetical protein
MNQPDQNIFNEKVLMVYKGEVTHGLLTSLLESFEERLEEIEPERMIRKKCFNIATECIENLRHHATHPLNGETINTNPSNNRSSMVMVTRDDHHYTFLTCNFITIKDIERITNKIDTINSFDEAGLRQYYKDTMANGSMSSKGTAGLGFIDIARKSGNKLNYEFHKINEDIYYYSFFVRLDRVI